MSDSLYVIKNAFSSNPTATITLKSNLPSFTSSVITLGSLQGVQISANPVDGEVLTYDGALKKFVNKPTAADGGSF
jgi:hypothetical protein